MNRYTRSDAEHAFQLLALALGKQESVWDKSTQSFNAGSWSLDYAPIYGGFVIEEHIETDSGSNSAVTRPLGDTRYPARQFCAMVHFALKVLAVKAAR